MKTNNNDTKALFKTVCLGVCTVGLLACGGGGGSTSSVEPSSNQVLTNFEPEAEKLSSAASASSELYVEQDFNFSHNLSTTLSLNLLDEQSTPIASSRINLYWIDSEALGSAPSEWKDEYATHAHLLSQGITNQQGYFTRMIDIPKVRNGQPLLLVEINVIGLENKVLVPVSSEVTQLQLQANRN